VNVPDELSYKIKEGRAAPVERTAIVSKKNDWHYVG
jgi:hypothetical protein